MAGKYRSVAKFTGVYTYASEKSARKKQVDLCYYIRFRDSFGKAVWEKIGWKSEGYTAQFASNVRNERIRGARHGDMPEVQKGVTFGKVWEKYDQWLESGRARPQDDRQRYKTHLQTTLEHMPMRLISPDLLEGIKADLERKGLAPATVKHCLVIVRQVFNKARKWKMYSGANPVSSITLPRVHNQRQRYLTQAEARALINEIISPQTRDMAILSLETGMRANEIFSLRPEDVNLEAGIISVRGKGSGDQVSRHVYITDKVRAILQSRPRTKSGYVFESRTGEKIRWVSEGFTRAVKRLGLNPPGTSPRNKVTFHTLRHTFASWLAISGTPLNTIKELLGHKSIAMTERYSHLCPDHKRSAAQAISSQWSYTGSDPETAQCPSGDTKHSGQA